VLSSEKEVGLVEQRHSHHAPAEGNKSEEQVFGLAVDLARTLLGWSWEGTLGLEDKITRVVNVYRGGFDDKNEKLETVIGAETGG
jgi:hypothetical protein